MSPFEPLINLLVLLGTLSIAAERLANMIKLADPELRCSKRRVSREAEQERQRRIANRVVMVSVLLAAAVRADFFAILSRLDAPWETLGWSGHALPATPSELLTSATGIVLTGLSLGFGSKFWHDLLDIIYGAQRNLRRHTRPRGARVAGA